MDDPPINNNDDEVVQDGARLLRDFIAPPGNGGRTSIQRPTINANNFEIKPALLTMKQTGKLELDQITTIQGQLSSLTNQLKVLSCNAVGFNTSSKAPCEL
ncbi:conserved hypothetical protein [Ricinus communis]|uniref:Uncharacterized protein n=1 Tax=Ricinus communis TaxID=3988 RepID=B9RWW8_RICCO|nr:conserved hypothetical protein [Ricinus communis]